MGHLSSLLFKITSRRSSPCWAIQPTSNSWVLWTARDGYCVSISSLTPSPCLTDTSDRDTGGSSRNSPAPGAGLATSLVRSTGRSGAVSTQRSGSQVLNKNLLEQLVQALHSLVASPNVPLRKRVVQISGAVVQVLELRHIRSDGLQQSAFATLGHVISNSQADNWPWYVMWPTP